MAWNNSVRGTRTQLKTSSKRPHATRGKKPLCLGFAAAAGLAPVVSGIIATFSGTRANAANVVYRLTSTGSTNLSAAPTANWTISGVASPAPNTGSAGNILLYNNSNTAATLTLDSSLTIGAINQGNNGGLTINGGGGTLTLDGTGLSAANSLTGTSGNVAYIGYNSGSGGPITINSSFVMATDLDIGVVAFSSSYPISITGNITAAPITPGATLNLTYRSSSTSNNNNGVVITDSGSIGISGGNIAISNLSVSTRPNTLTLSGNLGASVISVTQNSTTTQLTLSGNNSAFAGPINLVAGALGIGNANALGGTGAGGNITIAGGSTISNSSGSSLTLLSTGNQTWNGNFTFSSTNGLNLGTGAVTLGANVTITTVTSALTVGGNISGSGVGLSKLGSTNLFLTGNSTYSGVTNVGTAGSLTNVGNLTVGGTNGSLSGTSAINVTGGSFVSTTTNVNGNGVFSSSKLILDNTAGNLSRINDAADVTLSLNAELLVINNASAKTVESMGTLTFGTGASTVTMQGNGTLNELAIGNLSRSDHGVGLIRGTTYSQSKTNGNRITISGDISSILVGGNTSTLGIGATGTDTKLKIVPFLYGTNSTTGTGGLGFLTYDGNATLGGLRLLTAGEMVTAGSTTSLSPGDNVGTAGTTNGLGTRVFNSLYGTAAFTLNPNSGTDTLTINSGAILATATSTIGTFANLTLGNGEGIIFVTGATSPLTINTSVAVTNGGGLTKAGPGGLVLAKTNLYTGVTTVIEGNLTLGDGTSGGMAAGSGAIRFIGTGQTFFINMGNNTVLANDIVTTGPITRSGANTVNTLSGNISGSPSSTTSMSLTTGTTILTGNNTYTGLTTASGATAKLIVNNTTGSGTGTNTVRAQSGAALGGNGTISGVVTIADDSSLRPGADLNYGTIGILRTGSLTLGGATTLSIDADLSTLGNTTNSSLTHGEKLSDTIKVTGNVTLSGGKLELYLVGSPVGTNTSTIVLIENDGADAVLGTGTFSTFTPTNPLPNFAYTITYDYDTATGSFHGGNDVAIQFSQVPEPTSLSFLGLGVGGLLARRRRARRRP